MARDGENLLKRRCSARLVALFIVIIQLSVWEIASNNNKRLVFFVSYPSQILISLKLMIISEGLLTDIGITATEAIVGTLLGTILGSVLGLALWLSKQVAQIFSPFIVVAANFPVFALAPLAIIWLGIGITMKIFLSSLATFFVSLDLSYHGAKVAQDNYGCVFDGFRASYFDTYRKVILPGAIDAVFSSMRINVGFGILGAFIGEFIASERGLGRIIIRASGLYQIDRVFAAALCIIFLAVILNKAAFYLESKKLFIARLVGIPRRLRVRSKELAENK